MYDYLFGALCAAFFLASLFDEGAGGVLLNVFSFVFGIAAALHVVTTEYYYFAWVWGGLAVFSLAIALLRGVMLLRAREV
jgi:hypothetical protein